MRQASRAMEEAGGPRLGVDVWSREASGEVCRPGFTLWTQGIHQLLTTFCTASFVCLAVAYSGRVGERRELCVQDEEPAWVAIGLAPNLTLSA